MIFEKKIIKQYGLPRSGSNYIKWFIENNYIAKVNVNIDGWKHGPYKKSNKKCFATIKSPYSWIYSIYKFILNNKNSPFETINKTSVEKFLLSEFTIKYNQKTLKFKSPISYWNFIIKNWLDFNLSIIKYEDLLENAHETISKLNLKKINNLSLKNITEPGMETTIINNKIKFNIDFYLNKEYFNHINKNCIEIINNQIDQKLIEKFNYKITNEISHPRLLQS